MSWDMQFSRRLFRLGTCRFWAKSEDGTHADGVPGNPTPDPDRVVDRGPDPDSGSGSRAGAGAPDTRPQMRRVLGVRRGPMSAMEAWEAYRLRVVVDRYRAAILARWPTKLDRERERFGIVAAAYVAGWVDMFVLGRG